VNLHNHKSKGVLALKIADPAMGRIRLTLDVDEHPAIQSKVREKKAPPKNKQTD
jgi:hypothetical protein